VAIRITDPDTDTRIRIATLVRRALAEVCTVPVLLVLFMFSTSSVQLSRSDVDTPLQVGMVELMTRLYVETSSASCLLRVVAVAPTGDERLQT